MNGDVVNRTRTDIGGSVESGNERVNVMDGIRTEQFVEIEVDSMH